MVIAAPVQTEGKGKGKGMGEDADTDAGVAVDREGVRWTVTKLPASQSPITPKARMAREIKRQQ